MQGEWNRTVNISTGLDNIILLYRMGERVYTMYKQRTDYTESEMYQSKLINIFTS